MALAYLLCLAGSVLVLAVVLLRPRPAPTPPPAPVPAPAALPSGAEAEVRRILAAAAQLATRLDTAA
ncbi:hypothetical protein AB4Z54_00320 [Streptomyces sp. MCAF7]